MNPIQSALVPPLLAPPLLAPNNRIGALLEHGAEQRELIESLREELREMRLAQAESLERIEAGMDGMENLMTMNERVLGAVQQIRNVLRDRRSNNPLDLIRLYFIAIFTCMRLGYQAVFTIGGQASRTATSLIFPFTLAVVGVWALSALALLAITDVGLLFGSFGLIHYTGLNLAAFRFLQIFMYRSVGFVSANFVSAFTSLFGPYVGITRDVFQEETGLSMEYFHNLTTQAVDTVIGRTAEETARVVTDQAAQLPSQMMNATTSVVSNAASGAYDVIVGAGGSVVARAGALATGAGELATGALSTGAGALSTGAGALSTGAGALSTRAGALSTGAGAIATGARNAAASATGRVRAWTGMGGGDPFAHINVLNEHDLKLFNASSLGKQLLKLENVFYRMGNSNVKVEPEILKVIEQSLHLFLDKGVLYFCYELNKALHVKVTTDSSKLKQMEKIIMRSIINKDNQVKKTNPNVNVKTNVKTNKKVNIKTNVRRKENVKHTQKIKYPLSVY